MVPGLGYLEQTLLMLMDRSENGLTAPWAAEELWGTDATDAKKKAI